MLLEPVQVRVPDPPVRLEPGIELLQRRAVQLVHAPLRVRPRNHETGLAQHPQMLRGARLAEAETLDQLADLTRALSEKLQHSASVRIGERGPGRSHEPYITKSLYVCQGMDVGRN